MYNKIQELSDLSAEEAEQVYKKAVGLLKKDEPSVYLKCLMLAGAGGGVGVLCGSFLKDFVFKIHGLDGKAFFILSVCTVLGGVISGFIVSGRLEKKVKARFSEARKELSL